uniref:phage tail sheath subtilisin-like domain-containing protein n=1 Tax=Oceanobacter kriegii TaxID=64972 RepID=UPI000A019D9D
MSSHGTFVMELPATTPPVATIANAVIGIICTADDADVAVFPANTAVLLTNPRSGTASAGTTGTLLNTLTAIGNQTNAQVVVVRVPEGADAAKTETNLIGGDVDGKKTGMQALLSAQSKLGVNPRILGVPGLDTQAVTTALITVAQKLRAFVYAGCNGCTTKAEALTYRANFTARELMLIWPDFINDSGSVMPATAYALGSRAQIDNDIGWHKTLSNVAVDGVAGISADVYWDLMDPDCDAVQLNEAGITTLIGRKTGRRGGRDIVSYSFWGNRTCAAEPQFEFENYTRSAHKITEAVLESVFGDLDKPLNQARPQAILERLQARLRGMVHDGHLIGANAWSTTTDGIVSIDFDYTPVPPLENLTHHQRTTVSGLLLINGSGEYLSMNNEPITIDGQLLLLSTLVS